MNRLAAATASRAQVDTEVAYLEHNKPSVLDALLAHERDAASTPIDVVGLFLSDGYHAQVDVPKVLAEARTQVGIVDHGTLGIGRWLLPALERGLPQTSPSETQSNPGFVLAAAGSSRSQAREEVVQLAATWQLALQHPVRAAFASGPGSTVAEALATLRKSGCEQLAVALLIMAPGLLADRVVEATTTFDAPVGQPLADAPEVVDRILSVMASGMSCHDQ